MRCFKVSFFKRSLIFATLSLNGCAEMIQNQSASNSEQQVQQGGPINYPHPAFGDFLCFAVPNGTPIISGQNGTTIGYTGDVIAFGGQQYGNLIQIVLPSGIYAYINGEVIKPYGTANPGHTCVVYRPDGIHPKFVIN